PGGEGRVRGGNSAASGSAAMSPGAVSSPVNTTSRARFSASPGVAEGSITCSTGATSSGTEPRVPPRGDAPRLSRTPDGRLSTSEVLVAPEEGSTEETSPETDRLETKVTPGSGVVGTGGRTTWGTDGGRTAVEAAGVLSSKRMRSAGAGPVVNGV